MSLPSPVPLLTLERARTARLSPALHEYSLPLAMYTTMPVDPLNVQSMAEDASFTLQSKIEKKTNQKKKKKRNRREEELEWPN